MNQFLRKRESCPRGMSIIDSLLWVLRDSARLTGTKFGCGNGALRSGARHTGGESDSPCGCFPCPRAEGKHVTTIEGLVPPI